MNKPSQEECPACRTRGWLFCHRAMIHHCQVIMDARQLLGTAEKCSACGQIAPYVIGCPDGAEVCRDCFEAGQH